MAKNTIIISLGTFLPRFASFITLPILTAYLSKAEYGTYDLISVLVSLLLPVTTLQMQTAAFRFLIDTNNEIRKTQIITNSYAFVCFSSFISLIIVFFLLWTYPVELRSVICLYLFSDILVSTARQIVRGMSMNIYYSISAFISTFGKVITLIIFVVYLKTGLFGSILSLLIADTISFIFLFFSAKIYKHIQLCMFDWNQIKEMLSYSWPMVPNGMSTWAMDMSDRFVVTAFLGVAVNGVYSVSNKIPSLLALAQTTFSMAWQENASIYSKDNDAEDYYSSVFDGLFNMVAGFMGLLIAITPFLFVVLIKGDYQEAYLQMPILFMAMLFSCLSSCLGGVYIAQKKTKSVGITTILAALCNLIIDFSFISIIGLYAASISTLISYIALFSFRVIDMRKFIKMNYNWRKISICLIVLAVECILCSMRNEYADFVCVLISVPLLIILNRQLITRIMRKFF